MVKLKNMKFLKNFENYNEGINNFIQVKGKIYTATKDKILEIKKNDK